MASRIAYIPREEAPKARPAKRSGYLAFIHQLPCCITGQNVVQAAHISFASPWHGHYGRAKGTKAPDRFALPVCPAEHDLQHSGKIGTEREFWEAKGINPHELANTLFGIWSDYPEHEAAVRCTARIMAGLANIGKLKEREL